MAISRQQIYVIVVGAVALTVLIGAFVVPAANPLALLLFCALVAAAEWTTSTLTQGRSSISVSSAVSFAAALIFSPVHAGLVGAVGGLTAGISHARQRKHTLRRAAEVVAFNSGMVALATLAGAFVFQSLRGNAPLTALSLGDLPPLVLAALVNDQVNAAALVTMIAIQSGQRPFSIWRENFAWAAPINVATMAIGGGALVIGFSALGLTGLLVFFLPVLLSAYAFRAYIVRTQAVMAHLEEMVQARTADLANANQRLLEIHAQKDAYFAVITHDMRSPLTSLLGFSELLERTTTLENQPRTFLNAIQRNTETLITMVNDILELAKLDSGNMEYQWAPVNMTSVVGDVLMNTEGHALSRNIALERRIEPTPDIVGDPEKLRRLVTNLVSNAIKYTRTGGRVCVELRPVDREIKLIVRDTGIGIPTDQLPFIFERFRRVKRAGGHDAVGTGLGLAIVQEFAQAHGGRIDVESEVEVGSTFTVTLPVAFQPPIAE
jgi:signal transduction histidine kinase